MAIIKLTKQTFKTTDPTKTGWSNKKLVSQETILFNTDEMISAESTEIGNTRIKYKEALVNAFYCKEPLEEVYDLINAKSK